MGLKITVRFAETDQMKVVYHSNYFIYFECGRTNFFEELGYSYAVIEKDYEVLFPVTDVGCKYISPAKYGMKIDVQCKLSEFKGATAIFNYNIYNEGVLLATGFTKHAVVDKDFNVINLKKKYPEIYSALVNKKEK